MRLTCPEIPRGDDELRRTIFEVAGVASGQCHKTLRAVPKNWVGGPEVSKALLSAIGIDLICRGETLSVDELVELERAIIEACTNDILAASTATYRGSLVKRSTGRGNVMREVYAGVPGKVNPTLCVGAPMPDGCRPLVTVFEILNLCKTVTVRISKTSGIYVETIAYLPDGSIGGATTRAATDVDLQAHLAVRAAHALQHFTTADPQASTTAGLSIRVDKRAPIADGMAGGSAGAATTPVACNELWEPGLGAEQLQTVGRSLGADVPACLAGGITLGTGCGDHISILCERDKEGHHHQVILLSHQGLSTHEMLREFD